MSHLYDALYPEATGITVKEALNLGALTKARVVAGRGGLSNIVRHVSVIEVPDAVRWFSGHELMITAAYCYRTAKDLVQLVEDLVCADAAALAVCYSERYLHGIPETVIARANELEFPILEIPLDVRYIEIITPVVTAIVNRRAQYLDLAFQAHIELETQIIEGMGLEPMIQKLADLLKVPVLLLDPKLKVRFLACPPGEVMPIEVIGIDLRAALDGARLDGEESTCLVQEIDGINYFTVPLGAKALMLGYLVALETKRDDTKRLLLAQCSLPVALALLFERTFKEAEWRMQRGFFDDLLDGLIPKEVLQRRAHAYGVNLAGCHCVLVADTKVRAGRGRDPEQEDPVSIEKEKLKKMAIRMVDTEADGGFVMSRGDLLIVLPQFPKAHRRAVLQEAKRIAEMLAQEISRRLSHVTASIGVGCYCAEIGELPKGFSTARNAIEVGSRLRGSSGVHCWDDLGVYQLLLAVKGAGEPAAFVSERLRPLLDHSNPRNAELLQTLEVFLACRGNHEQTASRLHLHRNTVKYRLQQVRSRLGYDPMERSLEVELALALRKLQ
ncbi:MAG: PucR family transcriptional regulator ligand-binding domain-containing protein [Bacillota bacterium]|jgi:purine catabolism regulator